MDAKEALEKLRKDSKERKFDQSVDLIINLRGVDVKRDNIATIITLPNIVKEKKICGFLTKRTDLVNTVTEPDFAKYKDKAKLKSLVKDYDFFIAAAPLMPKVATAFGKVLGPVGKMPSPQLGMITVEDDATIKATLDKIAKSIKIRAKEPSIKVIVGKMGMSDDQILENVKAVYTGVVDVLPIKKDNIKNVMIKLTMSKPLKVEIK